jgi:hypothetical protein
MLIFNIGGQGRRSCASERGALRCAMLLLEETKMIGQYRLMSAICAAA